MFLIKHLILSKNRSSTMPEEIRNTETLNFENVWLMFKETDKKFQETDRQFQEMKELLDKRFQETDRQFKETDLKFKETDLKFQETDKQFKATDKKLRKLEELFTSQWGKLIESLVEGDLINLLNKKGIPVGVVATRVKHYFNKRQYEFDIIAENGNEIVIVEVKTTLKPDDVKEFEDELKVVKQVLPKYKEDKIYGAVAFLRDDGGAAAMAEKHGLFVIKATGNSSKIINSKEFHPKVW